MRPTGVAVVDHVLGGYPPGLPLVVAGPSGSGRTVLGLQLAHAALTRGERVEFVSSEPAPSLLHQAEALGFAFGSALRSGQLVLLELDAGASALVRAHGVDALAEALRSEAPEAEVVVVDPFTAITAEIVDEPRLREVARAFARALPVEHLVLTVEVERFENQRGLERVLGELCGAYLRLEREPGGRRLLAVEKSRSGAGAAERLEVVIGTGGLQRVDATPPRLVTRASLPLREEAGEAAPRRAPATRVHAPAPADAPAAPATTAAPPAVSTPRPEASAGDPPASAPVPTAPARRASEDAGTPTLLVVDDSRVQRELVSAWLSDRYRVVTAGDGFEALTALLSCKPALVVLDLIMPRVTGYEFLCALRRARLELPVLVTSSRVDRAGERLGPLVLGATDFLAKPLSRIELEHKIEMLLRLRPQRDARFDEAEAEALFGTVSHTRVLEAVEFRERLARACRFGERYELPSSLVRVTASSNAGLDRWVEVADQELRFEDAILRVSKRRALLLLVATPTSEAPKVIDRLFGTCARGRQGDPGLSADVQRASPAHLEEAGLEELAADLPGSDA